MNPAPHTAQNAPERYTVSAAHHYSFSKKPQESSVPGKNFLLATGIVNIILCSFAIIFGVGMLLSMDWWIGSFPATNDQAWHIYYGALVALRIYDLFVGITAVKVCKDISKGALMRNLVIIYLASSALLYFVITPALGLVSALGVPMIVITYVMNLIYPTLFMVGALKNKKEYDRQILRRI